MAFEVSDFLKGKGFYGFEKGKKIESLIKAI